MRGAVRIFPARRDTLFNQELFAGRTVISRNEADQGVSEAEPAPE